MFLKDLYQTGLSDKCLSLKTLKNDIHVHVYFLQLLVTFVMANKLYCQYLYKLDHHSFFCSWLHHQDLIWIPISFCWVWLHIYAYCSFERFFLLLYKDFLISAIYKSTYYTYTKVYITVWHDRSQKKKFYLPTYPIFFSAC